MSDFQFIDGELDMNFMYDRMMYRSNIFLEILIVREALLPNKEYLRNIDRLPHVSVVNCEPKTSKDILHIARSFYEKLYASIDIESYFDTVQAENILDDDAQQKCEGPISYTECTQALTKMKKSKSPGLDGITVEFYQAFWPLIGRLVVDVFNESHDHGTLPISQRKSVMSLIFKKGNEEDISNYRPISLTNVDYRLLAFTLAERMLARRAYQPSGKNCGLCDLEKFYIISRPELASLNQRNELATSCRHRKKHLLCNK